MYILTLSFSFWTSSITYSYINQLLQFISVHSPIARCQIGGGQSCSNQGVGHQQVTRVGGPESASSRAESQVQSAVRTSEAAYGPTEYEQKSNRQRVHVT